MTLPKPQENGKISELLEEYKKEKSSELWITFQEIGPPEVLELKNFLIFETPYRITRLNLNGNQIKDKGAIIIADMIPKVPSLVDINLAGNQIGDKGCIALMKSLHTNRNIVSLCLMINEITNQGGLEVAKMISKNSYLQALYLYLNQIGDEGGLEIARAVAKNNHVTTFWLDENPISLKGTEEIVSIITNNNQSLLNFELTTRDESKGKNQRTMIRVMLVNNSSRQRIRKTSAINLLKRRRVFLLSTLSIPIEIAHQILFTGIYGFKAVEEVILGSVLLNRRFLGQLTSVHDIQNFNNLKTPSANFSITGSELVRRCETLL